MKTRLVFDDKMCIKLFVGESLGRKPDWCLMIRWMCSKMFVVESLGRKPDWCLMIRWCVVSCL